MAAWCVHVTFVPKARKPHFQFVKKRQEAGATVVFKQNNMKVLFLSALCQNTSEVSQTEVQQMKLHPLRGAVNILGDSSFLVTAAPNLAKKSVVC